MSSPKYMVAVDFSPSSQAVVDHACELAHRAGAELHLVHVAKRAGSAMESAESTRVTLERLATLVRPTSELEIRTEKAALEGVPHQVLVDYSNSHSIDLIVMGTHGRKGFSHLALGSVAQRVLRRATCPVQVLRSAVTPPANGKTDTKAVDPSVESVEFVEMANEAGASPVRSPAAELIARARRLRATDVHIDPVDPTESVVRVRIDGQLSEYCRLDKEVAAHLLNQLKTMAGLDLAEPFKPKEGRIAFPASESEFRDLEARLTTIPVASGDAVAIRLFSREKLFIPLENLGFRSAMQSEIESMLHQSEGLILVTGPTGSGKTTTVYSMLETISSSGINIVSIEDPVEYFVPFVRQMEVKERYGITMTEGLKTMLRMDPDAVFLGEIRDTAAAALAMRAASAGRYVFSTLHTRDVASVVTSLRSLGLADRVIAANVSGIINQRLVRRLCTDCRVQAEVSQDLRDLLQQHGIECPSGVFRPVGCKSCRETGYLGRIGVFEAAAFDAKTRAAIASGSGESELRQLLTDRGMVSLDTDALAKVVDGITDFDEAMRARWLNV